MVVYQIDPIDYWGGWQKPSEVFRIDILEPTYDAEAWVKMWAKARRLAKLVGWEGDIREGPYVSGIPDEVESSIIIGWKQDNNGTTFIATPHKMPWLDPIAHEYVEENGKVVKV